MSAVGHTVERERYKGRVSQKGEKGIETVPDWPAHLFEKEDLLAKIFSLYKIITTIVMTPLVIFACRWQRQNIQGKIYEGWKLELAPDQKISPGMRVEIHSYASLSPIQGAVIVVREGIIGKRTHWEKRWAEYELKMDKENDLLVNILVPIKWTQMNLVDRIQHYRARQKLPDITPGPYPWYEKGKAQTARGSVGWDNGSWKCYDWNRVCVLWVCSKSDIACILWWITIPHGEKGAHQ